VLSGSGIAAPPYDTAEGAPFSVIGSASERWAGIGWRDWLIGLRGALRDPAALAARLDAHDSSVNRRYNFKDMPFE
jgi:hypothetical protein